MKRSGQGVRILSCFLPSQSPWLNRIEAKWGHGKRAVAEFDRPLGLDEIEARVCAYYRCAMTDHLIHPSLRKTEYVTLSIIGSPAKVVFPRALWLVLAMFHHYQVQHYP